MSLPRISGSPMYLVFSLLIFDLRLCGSQIFNQHKEGETAHKIISI